MSIDPFSFDPAATTAQKNAIRPALESISGLIGPRLKPIVLVPKPSAKMPDWDSSSPGVQPAWELWKGWNSRTNRRELWFWDQLHLRVECGPTIMHGAMHAYDSYYLTEEMRSGMMDLMHARPEAWRQGLSWSKFPFECFAVYGSAALFGLAKPVYGNLLDRKVYRSDWGKLREIILG